MKTPTLIFLSFLALLFSGFLTPETKAEVSVSSKTQFLSENFSVARPTDFLAVETVESVTPPLMRVLRKPGERVQKPGCEISDGYTEFHFASINCCRPKALISFSMLGDLIAVLSHDADYLRFGILVI